MQIVNSCAWLVFRWSVALGIVVHGSGCSGFWDIEFWDVEFWLHSALVWHWITSYCLRPSPESLSLSILMLKCPKAKRFSMLQRNPENTRNSVLKVCLNYDYCTWHWRLLVWAVVTQMVKAVGHWIGQGFKLQHHKLSLLRSWARVLTTPRRVVTRQRQHKHNQCKQTAPSIFKGLDTCARRVII